MHVLQAHIMSTAEVFGRDSVACLIYNCVSTASSLFYETQVIVIYLVCRRYYWMAAESDLSSPLATPIQMPCAMMVAELDTSMTQT